MPSEHKSFLMWSRNEDSSRHCWGKITILILFSVISVFHQGSHEVPSPSSGWPITYTNWRHIIVTSELKGIAVSDKWPCCCFSLFCIFWYEPHDFLAPDSVTSMCLCSSAPGGCAVGRSIARSPFLSPLHTWHRRQASFLLCPSLHCVLSILVPQIWLTVKMFFWTGPAAATVWRSCSHEIIW